MAAKKPNRSSSASPASARYAYEGLQRAIHEKARLGIMTCLATHPDGLSFTDLKELCGLTDGNLNRHLDVLQEGGLVEVRKLDGQGRRQTVCRVTARGRTEFVDYLAELEQVVADAAEATRAKVRSAARSARPRAGWTTT